MPLLSTELHHTRKGVEGIEVPVTLSYGSSWNAGEEYVKDIVLKNVRFHAVKVTCKNTKGSSMDALSSMSLLSTSSKTPIVPAFTVVKPVKTKGVSPGTFLRIPILFRPTEDNMDYSDVVDIDINNGEHVVQVKLLAEAARATLSFPRTIELGEHAINSKATTSFTISNPTVFTTTWKLQEHHGFQVTPPFGVLSPEEECTVNVTFTPTEAKPYCSHTNIVFDATTNPQADEEDDESEDENDDNGAEDAKGDNFNSHSNQTNPLLDSNNISNATDDTHQVRELPITLKGVGKFPYLSLENGMNELTIDFGQQPSCHVQNSKFSIINHSGVVASFDIKHSFLGSPCCRLLGNTGAIEPYATHEFEVEYTAGPMHHHCNEYFRFNFVSGASLRVTCQGDTSSPQILCDTKEVNFGGMEIGGIVSKVVTLRNSSIVSTPFSAVLGDVGPFLVHCPPGNHLIPALDEVEICIEFAPSHPHHYLSELIISLEHHAPVCVQLSGRGLLDPLATTPCFSWQHEGVVNAKKRIVDGFGALSPHQFRNRVENGEIVFNDEAHVWQIQQQKQELSPVPPIQEKKMSRAGHDSTLPPHDGGEHMHTHSRSGKHSVHSPIPTSTKLSDAPAAVELCKHPSQLLPMSTHVVDFGWCPSGSRKLVSKIAPKSITLENKTNDEVVVSWPQLSLRHSSPPNHTALTSNTASNVNLTSSVASVETLPFVIEPQLAVIDANGSTTFTVRAKPAHKEKVYDAVVLLHANFTCSVDTENEEDINIPWCLPVCLRGNTLSKNKPAPPPPRTPSATNRQQQEQEEEDEESISNSKGRDAGNKKDPILKKKGKKPKASLQVQTKPASNNNDANSNANEDSNQSREEIPAYGGLRVDFGDCLSFPSTVPNTPSYETFWVFNDGNIPMPVSIFGPCDDHTCEILTPEIILGPNERRLLTASIVPHTTGKAQFSFAVQAPHTVAVMPSNCLCEQPLLALQKEKIAFGRVCLGQTGSAEVVLYNPHNVCVHYSFEVMNSHSDNEIIIFGDTGTIEPNEEVKHSVVIYANDLGVFSAKLLLHFGTSPHAFSHSITSQVYGVVELPTIIANTKALMAQFQQHHHTENTPSLVHLGPMHVGAQREVEMELFNSGHVPASFTLHHDLGGVLKVDGKNGGDEEEDDNNRYICLPPRCRRTISLFLSPRHEGEDMFSLRAEISDSEGIVISSQLVLTCAFEGVRSKLVFSDARSEVNSVVELWRTWDLVNINQALSPLPNQAPERTEFPLDFGCASHLGETSVVHVQLQNTSKCACEWRAALPMDLKWSEETWAVPDFNVGDTSDDDLFDFQPRRGKLGIGEACTITISYKQPHWSARCSCYFQTRSLKRGAKVTSCWANLTKRNTTHPYKHTPHVQRCETWVAISTQSGSFASQPK
eukprot:m.229448 g.229448  ORF g.229448 m.229448 type:complete len:1404 (-) comp13883_c0_seq4:5428-9639(-)